MADRSQKPPPLPAPRAPRNEWGLYSAVEEAVLGDKAPTKASPEQWLGWLKNQPGVKDEELQWTGLQKWLASQPGPVTREAVQGYMAENKVPFHVSMLGRDKNQRFEAERRSAIDPLQSQLLPLIEERDRLQSQINSSFDDLWEPLSDAQSARTAAVNNGDADGRAYWTAEIDRINTEMERRRAAAQQHIDRLHEIQPQITRLSDAIEDVNLRYPSNVPPTKWSAYQLPGGAGYTELLVQLGDQLTPEGRALEQERAALARSLREQYGERWITQAPAADRDRYQEIETRLDELTTSRLPYQSSHWNGRDNVLGHLRFNERTTPDGRRVLFVEENQSDWHQAGRDKGYVPQDAMDEVSQSESARNAALRAHSNAANEGRQYLIEVGDVGIGDRHKASYSSDIVLMLEQRQGDPRALQLANQINDADRALAEAQDRVKVASDRVKSGIPDAPLKDNRWAAFNMKLATKYAADNDFDAVAWVPGEVPVERFGLQSHVESIETGTPGSNPTNPNTRIVRIKALPINGRARTMNLEVRDDGMVLASMGTPQGVNGKPLSEVVGKEMAERIMSSPGETISGDGLRIGGEGMRSFYDRVLPNIVNNEIGKPYGLRVGEDYIDITPKPGRLAFTVLDPNGQPFDEYDDLEQARAAARDAGKGYRVQEGTMKVPALQLPPEAREQIKARGFRTFGLAGALPVLGVAGATYAALQPQPAAASTGDLEMDVGNRRRQRERGVIPRLALNNAAALEPTGFLAPFTEGFNQGEDLETAAAKAPERLTRAMYLDPLQRDADALAGIDRFRNAIIRGMRPVPSSAQAPRQTIRTKAPPLSRY